MPLIPARTTHWSPPDAAVDAEDGAARAGALIARLQAGASDPDALLRSLLDTLAESGRIVAPDCRLRGFCKRLSEQIAPRQKT